MKISYGKQFLDNKDYKFVLSSLKKPLLSGGQQITKFEEKIKKFLKTKQVLACSSGTAGLHMAFYSLNIKKNDIIIMPTINFVASYNIASQYSSKIFFADVDPISGQMTAKTLIECIKKNKIKKIRVLLTMYLGGDTNNLSDFINLKKKYKFILIEDACHAFGSKYSYRKKVYNVGNCKYSDICVFSFHPLKSITTGEGGAVVSKNLKIFNKMKLFRSHGIKRDKKKYWSYDVIINGLNYRISDINCSLGISQLEKLKKFISKRRLIANKYINQLKKNSLIDLPKQKMLSNSSWHLFIISINFRKLKQNKDKFFKFMNDNEIYPQYHYVPLYKFSILKKKKINFKGSEYYYNNAVSLPIYYKLTHREQNKVIKKIGEFLKLNEKK